MWLKAYMYYMYISFICFPNNAQYIYQPQQWEKPPSVLPTAKNNVHGALLC